MADLSEFKRGQIVRDLIVGVSVTKTVELFGVAESTVSNVMTAFGKEGKTSSLKQNPGRKRKLSDWDRPTLRRTVQKDLKNKSPKITAELNDHLENQFPQKVLEGSCTKPDFTGGVQSKNYIKIDLFKISRCLHYFVQPQQVM